MNILGLESSCDETAASVVSVENGVCKVLSDIIASQVETHKVFGGVVPEIASRAHVEAISSITKEALATARCTLSDIDVIAVTANPGLIGALLVAVNFGKSLAYANDIPLVAVDHMKGHVAASYLTENPPKPPFLALAVSGGHTSIYHVASYTDYTVIGQTRDDAIGEAFDKIGRLLGFSYPAGKAFDDLASEGFIKVGGYGNFKKSAIYKDKALYLPSPAINDGTLDFSFSGLKTAAINLLHRYTMKDIILPRAEFAARYTFEVVEAVAKKIDTALDFYKDLPLVLAGGVAANSHLRARLSAVCQNKKRDFIVPPFSLCADNGAMIATQGYYTFLAKDIADTSLNASAVDRIKKGETIGTH